MTKHINKGFLSNLKNDLPAGLVVFLVALPLCLGIALASEAPLFSGIIAGIVGGIVVGAISKSQLGVSGPAAGLAAIVLTAIPALGGFEIFLVAVVLAGVFQVILGIIKAGVIGYYFPNSVIKGMLSGIGIIIIIKQIPHAFGYDKDPEGDFSFFQPDGQNTFSELFNMIDFISVPAVIITVVCLAILILWERPFFKNHKYMQYVPGPLLAVLTGAVLAVIFNKSGAMVLEQEHMVNIPVSSSLKEMAGLFVFPDFSAITNPAVILTAATIAVVASLETLLCVEATDKLDPYKRITPTNRELLAQGAGNIFSGLIGGLPITQVIVRSSANIQSGGKTKVSAIFHGFLLLIAAFTIPTILNTIPKASLAAILFLVGYKLAKPAVFKEVWSKGIWQFIPFIATILVMVFKDLLWGVGVGMMIAFIQVLWENFKIPYYKADLDHPEEPIIIRLSEQVSFLNKPRIMNSLREIPDGSIVIVDATRSEYIHSDVQELLKDFEANAEEREIDFKVLRHPDTK